MKKKTVCEPPEKVPDIIVSFSTSSRGNRRGPYTAGVAAYLQRNTVPEMSGKMPGRKTKIAVRKLKKVKRSEVAPSDRSSKHPAVSPEIIYLNMVHTAVSDLLEIENNQRTVNKTADTGVQISDDSAQKDDEDEVYRIYKLPLPTLTADDSCLPPRKRRKLREEFADFVLGKQQWPDQYTGFRPHLVIENTLMNSSDVYMQKIIFDTVNVIYKDKIPETNRIVRQSEENLPVEATLGDEDAVVPPQTPAIVISEQLEKPPSLCTEKSMEAPIEAAPQEAPASPTKHNSGQLKRSRWIPAEFNPPPSEKELVCSSATSKPAPPRLRRPNTPFSVREVVDSPPESPIQFDDGHNESPKEVMNNEPETNTTNPQPNDSDPKPSCTTPSFYECSFNSLIPFSPAEGASLDLIDEKSRQQKLVQSLFPIEQNKSPKKTEALNCCSKRECRGSHTPSASTEGSARVNPTAVRYVQAVYERDSVVAIAPPAQLTPVVLEQKASEDKRIPVITVTPCSVYPAPYTIFGPPETDEVEKPSPPTEFNPYAHPNPFRGRSPTRGTQEGCSMQGSTPHPIKRETVLTAVVQPRRLPKTTRVKKQRNQPPPINPHEKKNTSQLVPPMVPPMQPSVSVQNFFNMPQTYFGTTPNVMHYPAFTNNFFQPPNVASQQSIGIPSTSTRNFPMTSSGSGSSHYSMNAPALSLPASLVPLMNFPAQRTLPVNGRSPILRNEQHVNGYPNIPVNLPGYPLMATNLPQAAPVDVLPQLHERDIVTRPCSQADTFEVEDHQEQQPSHSGTSSSENIGAGQSVGLNTPPNSPNEAVDVVTEDEPVNVETEPTPAEPTPTEEPLLLEDQSASDAVPATDEQPMCDDEELLLLGENPTTVEQEYAYDAEAELLLLGDNSDSLSAEELVVMEENCSEVLLEHTQDSMDADASDEGMPELSNETELAQEQRQEEPEIDVVGCNDILLDDLYLSDSPSSVDYQEDES